MHDRWLGFNIKHLSLNSYHTAALKNYQKHNGGNLPSSVFIYRDGVGDGQINHVKDHEIAQIQNAIQQYAPDQK